MKLWIVYCCVWGQLLQQTVHGSCCYCWLDIKNKRFEEVAIRRKTEKQN